MLKLLLRFETVFKVNVVRGLENSEAGAWLIQRRNFNFRIQKLHFKVGQHQRQKLFNLMNSEKSSRTFGDSGAERHVVIPQLTSSSVKTSLLLSVFIQESVVLVRLRGKNSNISDTWPGGKLMDDGSVWTCQVWIQNFTPKHLGNSNKTTETLPHTLL